MTQEQRITKGTIIIFIMSILLLVCLCVTATLAYFAGNQQNKTTLIMGGPVRVTMVDDNYSDTIGQGKLTMDLNSTRDKLLPGMGIDMQAIAKVTSSDINSTPALLRAILEIDVKGVNAHLADEIEYLIQDAMTSCLTTRIDSSSPNARDGWVPFESPKYGIVYYYCSQTRGVIEETNEEFIEVKAIPTSAIGNNITFINGIFQFPYKFYTNKYSDVEIIFNLRFQAIQDKLVDENGERIPNTIFNVQEILDNQVDWETHNN
ncbi:MAG: hypothetical protein E7354_04835 [Clostridiales bacterium]|nr:hypothetical protein [Clostridiales bacterium]